MNPFAFPQVLQLGTILSLTGTWKSHQLRVSVFVEEASEVDEERRRVRSLLDNLRIPASLRVFCLSDKTVSSYEAIVLGETAPPPHVEEALKGDPWWNTLKKLRKDERARQAAAAKRAQQQAAATDIPGGAAGSSSTGASGSATPRSKREQKLLGYSLPPEHLEYFQRNIRIGLRHPRAKPRVDDSDVEDDDDSGSSDGESDGSGLSDELLRLGEDGFFGGALTRSNSTTAYGAAAARHRGFRSGRGRSHSQGTIGGLPDEPALRRQRYHNSSENGGTTTPGPGSYGSMASTPIVRPDGTIAKPGGLRFSGRGETVIDEESQGEGTLKASDRSRLQRHLSSRPSPPGSRSSSRASSRSSQHRLAYSTVAGEDSNTSASATASSTTLNFNTLPNKAQFLILNQLFRAHSSSSATSVILTSLPAPEPGTAKDPDAVQRYLAQLEILCAGSTPVLGIHARELTLSMSL